MRIPYPERFSLGHAIGFATFLSAVQLYQGTSPYFSLCSFLFIVIATIAFNLAGGLTRPSGAYVFFYALLAVIVGLCWKAILGEPADSHLLLPLLTMQVFLGGITAMLGAVFISRRLTAKRPLLGRMVIDANIQNATFGCMVTGLILTGALMLVPWKGGSILSSISQINRFLPMAIILGVIHQIRKSGGTSSINLPVLISGAAIFAVGLISFSKEGMFTPLVCWLVAVGSQRYKIKLYQVVGIAVVAIFMLQYLVPFSQYGRNYESETRSVAENARTAITLLSDLDSLRKKAADNATEGYDAGVQGYFDSPQGLFERLQMITVDDSLIDVTESKGTFGYAPIYSGFANFVPRVFWATKPSIGYGNLYAHQIGGLAEDDVTTGISFSPTGEAYHIDRWVGVLIVAPALWIMLFTLFDSLCGSVRETPWGLLVIALFSHTAPEGMLGSVIYMLGFSAFSIVVAAFSATYVMPLLGALVKGPERVVVHRSNLIRSQHRASSAISRWRQTPS
ncbi:MAG TPA: hypothetical protein VIX42_00950 [Edaphobacter sp.]